MCLVEKLLSKIEGGQYECIAGYLQNDSDWQDLRRIVMAQQDEIDGLARTVETYRHSDNEKSALLFSLLNTE